MKQQKFILTFYDENGEVIQALSKDPASPQDLMAAANFLTPGCEIRLACVTCDEKGNRID